jgi:ATP adenylyltransferase
MDGAVRLKILLGSIFFMIAGDCAAECACSSMLLGLEEDAVYAPWRDTYKEVRKQVRSLEDKTCIFCCLPAEEGHNFILARYEHCFVVLNIYPYTKGHLLVIPYQHTSRLSELPEAARLEIMNVIAQSVDILEQELRCIAFNIGVNIGEGAKASVPDHLHVHVMPRYKVDAGFAHLIGGTKVVAWDLEELYERLLPCFCGNDCLGIS